MPPKKLINLAAIITFVRQKIIAATKKSNWKSCNSRLGETTIFVSAGSQQQFYFFFIFFGGGGGERAGGGEGGGGLGAGRRS